MKTKISTIKTSLKNFFFGNVWFRTISLVVGVVGLICGIFKTILFFKDCIKSTNFELVIITYFLLIVICLLVFLAIWYEVHITIQVAKAKESFRKEDLGATVSYAVHNFVHEYRKYYYKADGKDKSEYRNFFKELFSLAEPVITKMLGSKHGIDCVVKLINTEKKLVSIFRNREEREIKTPESTETNYIFDYFSNLGAHGLKYLLLNDITTDLKDNKTPAGIELKRRAVDKYNSILVIPLYANIPDVHIKGLKKITIENPKPMVGFISFDSMSKNLFKSFSEWYNEDQNDYGLFNFFFFYADLISCFCYQLNIEGIRDAIGVTPKPQKTESPTKKGKGASHEGIKHR